MVPQAVAIDERLDDSRPAATRRRGRLERTKQPRQDESCGFGAFGPRLFRSSSSSSSFFTARRCPQVSRELGEEVPKNFRRFSIGEFTKDFTDEVDVSLSTQERLGRRREGGWG